MSTGDMLNFIERFSDSISLILGPRGDRVAIIAPKMSLAAAKNSWGVLTLFLIPFGGGIPAGVLLAQTRGIAWPITSALYFASDVILAFLFEPLLALTAAAGRRIPKLGLALETMRVATRRSAEKYGIGAGPLTLVLIAFGIDPMTGRAAAAAAGHGFLAGWAIAIAGDMMYFALIMFATLELSAYFGNPELAAAAVMFGMFLVPPLFRKLREKLRWT